MTKIINILTSTINIKNILFVFGIATATGIQASGNLNTWTWTPQHPDNLTIRSTDSYCQYIGITDELRNTKYVNISPGSTPSYLIRSNHCPSDNCIIQCYDNMRGGPASTSGAPDINCTPEGPHYYQTYTYYCSPKSFQVDEVENTEYAIQNNAITWTWPTQYSRVMLQAGTNCISFNVFESGDYRLARRVQTRPGGIHILEKSDMCPGDQECIVQCYDRFWWKSSQQPRIEDRCDPNGVCPPKPFNVLEAYDQYTQPCNGTSLCSTDTTFCSTAPQTALDTCPQQFCQLAPTACPEQCKECGGGTLMCTSDANFCTTAPLSCPDSCKICSNGTLFCSSDTTTLCDTALSACTNSSSQCPNIISTLENSCNTQCVSCQNGSVLCSADGNYCDTALSQCTTDPTLCTTALSTCPQNCKNCPGGTVMCSTDPIDPNKCQTDLCPTGQLFCSANNDFCSTAVQTCSNDQSFCPTATALCPQCKDCPGGNLICSTDPVDPQKCQDAMCPTGDLLCSTDQTFCSTTLQECAGSNTLCSLAPQSCPQQCPTCPNGTVICSTDPVSLEKCQTDMCGTTGSLLCDTDTTFCSDALDGCTDEPLFCQKATQLCATQPDFCSQACPCSSQPCQGRDGLGTYVCSSDLICPTCTAPEPVIPIVATPTNTPNVSEWKLDLNNIPANYQDHCISIVRNDQQTRNLWFWISGIDQTDDNWFGMNQITISQQSTTSGTTFTFASTTLTKTITCSPGACPELQIKVTADGATNISLDASLITHVEATLCTPATRSGPVTTCEECSLSIYSDTISGKTLPSYKLTLSDLQNGPYSDQCIDIVKNASITQPVFFWVENADNDWGGVDKLTIQPQTGTPPAYTVTSDYRNQNNNPITISCPNSICPDLTISCYQTNASRTATQEVDCTSVAHFEIGECKAAATKQVPTLCADGSTQVCQSDCARIPSGLPLVNDPQQSDAITLNLNVIKPTLCLKLTQDLPETEQVWLFDANTQDWFAPSKVIIQGPKLTGSQKTYTISSPSGTITRTCPASGCQPLQLQCIKPNGTPTSCTGIIDTTIEACQIDCQQCVNDCPQCVNCTSGQPVCSDQVCIGGTGLCSSDPNFCSMALQSLQNTCSRFCSDALTSCATNPVNKNSFCAAANTTCAQSCKACSGTLLCDSNTNFCTTAQATCSSKECGTGSLVCDTGIDPAQCKNALCPDQNGQLLCSTDQQFCTTAINTCKTNPQFCTTAKTACPQNCKDCTGNLVCDTDADFCSITKTTCAQECSAGGSLVCDNEPIDADQCKTALCPSGNLICDADTNFCATILNNNTCPQNCKKCTGNILCTTDSDFCTSGISTFESTCSVGCKNCGALTPVCESQCACDCSVCQ